MYIFCTVTVVRTHVLCCDSVRRKKYLKIAELYDLFHLSASECATILYILRVVEYPGGS